MPRPSWRARDRVCLCKAVQSIAVYRSEHPRSFCSGPCRMLEMTSRQRCISRKAEADSEYLTPRSERGSGWTVGGGLKEQYWRLVGWVTPCQEADTSTRRRGSSSSSSGTVTVDVIVCLALLCFAHAPAPRHSGFSGGIVPISYCDDRRFRYGLTNLSGIGPFSILVPRRVRRYTGTSRRMRTRTKKQYLSSPPPTLPCHTAHS